MGSTKHVDMRKRSKSPHRVRSFFGHNTFRYAAQIKIAQAGSIISLHVNACAGPTAHR